MWIFKKKEGIQRIEKPIFKLRLVVKDFTTVDGIDYNKIFSHVVKDCSIKIFMEILNQYNMDLE